MDKKYYTDDEIENMTWSQKSDLIQKEPVTCARNFEHMVQLFITDVLKSNPQPIGEIIDLFYRVEFQQRGSPHINAFFVNMQNRSTSVDNLHCPGQSN